MRTFLVVACFTAVSLGAALPTIPPVTLGPAWTTIQMPEMPLGIAEHDGELWVCGANEMIASSADNGEHWIMRNLHRDGEMLFTLAFVGAKIEAFGSGGTWLVSNDGGDKWRRSQIQPPQDLETVDFGSDNNAYGANAGVFGWSNDGGTHWRFANFEFAGQYGPSAIATADGNHSVFLYPQADGSNQSNNQHLVVTTDGGQHWSTVTLNHDESWTGLRTSDRGYVLLGSKGTKPAEIFSSDGLTWSSQTPTIGDAYSCTQQGCLIEKGWVQTAGASTKRWSRPSDSADSFFDSWAATAATFCHVGVAVRCRRGQEPWAPSSSLPTTPVASGQVISAKCLSCPPPAYPEFAMSNRQQGTVILHALVGPKGTIEQLRVLGAGWSVLAQAAIDTVRTWKYQPMRLNGKPVPVDTTIAVKFQRNH